MQLTINRSALKSAVDAAVGAIDARATLPALTHLLLETGEHQTVRITGGNMEQWVTITTDAVVNKPGRATVPAKLLQELLSQLDAQSIDLQTNERYKTTIRTETASFQLHGLPPSEYPEPIQVEPIRDIMLPTEQLTTAIRAVDFAVGKEQYRPALTGVLLSIQSTELRTVATDSNRLAMYTLTLQEPADTHYQGIVPPKAFHLLQKTNPNETVTLSLCQNRLQIATENATVTTQLIEANYPNYERVIPTEFNDTWVVPTTAFKTAIKRALLTADRQKIYLEPENDRLKISSEGQHGRGEEYIPFPQRESKTPVQKVAVNGHYLLDAIQAMPNDEHIQLDLNEPYKPIKITHPNHPNYLYIVMPMAL